MKLKNCLFLAIFPLMFHSSLIAQNNVGIGTTTPDPTSILELSAFDKGLLVPRVSTAQRMAISVMPSSNGLLVYDIDFNCFYYYVAAGNTWTSLCSASGVAGATGATGANGANGVTGAASTVPGPTGPTGLIGATGATGTNGLTGPAGFTGATGSTGITGATGIAGTTGMTGPSGANGTTGASGLPGATGSTGPVGCSSPNYILKSDGTSATCTLAPIYEDNSGKVGIGNTSPVSLLSVGNASPFQINNSGDAVKIKNVSYSWPASQGATKTVLTNDGSGNLSWAAPYGVNVQYATGTTDITLASTSYTDMSQMTVTFTPVHSVVFVSFTASGYADLAIDNPMLYLHAQIVKDGSPIKGVCAMGGFRDDPAGTALSGWNLAIIYPVSVTPGVSTTIKIQWLRDGYNLIPVLNNASTQGDFNHRTLFIYD
jgi:hypothetical protein